MACPVNSPFYQALLILLGVIIVIARHVKASPSLPPLMQGSAAASLPLEALLEKLASGWEEVAAGSI